jgi:hypothetical protein
MHSVQIVACSIPGDPPGVIIPLCIVVIEDHILRINAIGTLYNEEIKVKCRAIGRRSVSFDGHGVISFGEFTGFEHFDEGRRDVEMIRKNRRYSSGLIEVL